MQIINNNIINVLDKYISHFDKKWKCDCVPSSKEIIDKLKIYTKMDLINLDFPKDFVDFICFAGESDGGLFEAVNGNMDINVLLDESQDLFENWEDEINPMIFEFMTDNIGISYVINFNDSQKIWYENECTVSSSFGKFLLQCAIRKYERTNYNYQINLSFNSFLNKNEEVKNIVKLKKMFSEDYNLEVQEYSDEFFWYAKSSQVSMYIRMKEYSNGKRYTGMIFFNEYAIIDGIMDKLKNINNCIPEVK